ncbi:hypothetical protein [Paenibacillus sp. ISL-20]|uniref:hypothetical protein n=1 Tax=Paenibacillus sp. ISL-20 TaxID=2819163 RepID=UPI001BE90A77|nr:hypothetical protein [Paenibacillus sp. ISL-20]MBT2765794.1 hypothetical protein [Paenibacillus sp. ISL-20]
MKKLCAAIIVFSILLSGCRSTTEIPTNTEQKTWTEVPKQENDVTQFTPLDESKYEGTQKEMIKLINLYAKYVNLKDEDKFKELFDNQDYGLPSFEILGLEVDEFQQMKGNQGNVSIKLTVKSLEDNMLNEERKFWYYISFNEEEGKWKIMSID